MQRFITNQSRGLPTLWLLTRIHGVNTRLGSMPQRLLSSKSTVTTTSICHAKLYGIHPLTARSCHSAYSTLNGPSFWQQLTPLSKTIVAVGVGSATLFLFPSFFFVGYGLYRLTMGPRSKSSSSSASSSPFTQSHKNTPNAEDMIRDWFKQQQSPTGGSGQQHTPIPFGAIGLLLGGIARLFQGVLGSMSQARRHAHETHCHSIERIEHVLRDASYTSSGKQLAELLQHTSVDHLQYSSPYSVSMQQETISLANGQPASTILVEIRFSIRSKHGDILADVLALGQPRQNNDIRLRQVYLQSPRTGQQMELPLNNNGSNGRHQGGKGTIIDADYRVL
ncbi:hypothetical protein BDF22DRAFT_668326 [Syncephalis plumigaleata]|nr:hypothetical protein BDF22DRAFT_668326 [Syncephalis plumigaleata]